MITFAFFLACAAAAPPVPLPEAPVSRYELVLPGVIPASIYDQVRAQRELGDALDQRLLPSLASDLPPAARVTAFVDARTQALDAYAKAKPSGPPKVPTAEQLASGGIGPPPGDPLLRSFDTVCTDVLRTWFRGYAAWLAHGGGTPAQRSAALVELEAAAPAAFPWAAGQGESARVEVMLAKQAMFEASP